MRLLLLILFIITNCTLGQSYHYSKSIGDFNSASAFSVKKNLDMIILDSESNEVVMMNSSGEVLESFGGYGWNPREFDELVDVFIDYLNIYITDKNNNRIQIFDKDLNYITSLSSDNISQDTKQFAYPLGCVVSAVGDIFILDSDNLRILKYDSNGKFQLEFGNYLSGDFAVTDPKGMAINYRDEIFILDDNNILKFDQFGSGLLKFKLPFESYKIRTYSNFLFTWNDSTIFKTDLTTGFEPFKKIRFYEQPDMTIVDVAFVDNKLFVLTQTNILLFDYIK